MTTSAKFPSALLALGDVFGEMPNFPQLTLNGSINASVTSIVVNESIPSTWPQVMWITIDSEILHVTSWATKTFTVAARDGSAGNAQSTTAATHADKAYVTPALTAQQWNQLVADVIAMQGQDSKGADIASNTTTDLSTATGGYVHITGTTTITGFGTLPAGRVRILKFDGILTLTYNATSLILQGATDLTTAAGDVVAFVSEGSGNWRELSRRLAAAASSPAAGGTLVSRFINNSTVNVSSTGAYVDFGGGYTTTITTQANDKVHVVVQSVVTKTTASYAAIVVDRGGTKLPAAGGSSSVIMSQVGGTIIPFALDFWDTPGAGTFTYKPQVFSGDANAATAGSGNSAQMVVELWR